jgi:hypothetical protein
MPLQIRGEIIEMMSFYFYLVYSASIPSASSDEDIDPELREGIHNIM